MLNYVKMLNYYFVHTIYLCIFVLFLITTDMTFNSRKLRLSKSSLTKEHHTEITNN